MLIWLALPLFAFLDRLCGGWPPAPGRGIFWAVPVVIAWALVGFGFSVVASLLAGLAYAATRGPGWAIFGGKIDPRTREEVLGTLMRHAFVITFLVPMVLDRGLQPAFIGIFAYPVVATLLAMWNAHAYDQGEDINGWIEAFRGLFLGFTLAALLV